MTSGKVTEQQRRNVDRTGRDTGCHTCGSREPGEGLRRFSVDHQPATALNTTNEPQRLYPHCVECMREQGMAVGAARFQQLRQERSQNLGVGPPGKNEYDFGTPGVPSHAQSRPNAADGYDFTPPPPAERGRGRGSR
jgi:hypothetical protein